MRVEIDTSEAQRRVRICAEVEGVVGARNQTKAEQAQSPQGESKKMKGEHQEDGQTEQKQCPHKVRRFRFKPSHPALMQHKYTVETSAVQQYEEDQNESPDPDSRHRFDFIGNPVKECWHGVKLCTLLSGAETSSHSPGNRSLCGTDPSGA